MATQRGLIKVGVFTAAVILLILATIGITSTYLKFKNDTNNLAKLLKRVETIRWTDESFSENFLTLDKYRQQLEKLEDAPFLGGSIYRSDQLVKDGDQLYFAKLKPFMTTYLYDDILSKNLRGYLRNDPNVYRDQAYNYLRAYLLMGNDLARLDDAPSEKEFLKSEVLALVDTLLEDRFNFAYQSTRNENLRSLRSLIKNQISYFIEILGNEDYFEDWCYKINLIHINRRS